ncbi:glutathione synthase [Aestuariivirga sp.]|uniref:glutathione synthase n=1 Tax=Aestuariivirga sp. TaxID=2650926 RepID=UPI0025BF6C03|nr:glutathione synthase [Aestuariivirga sp.]MCA3555939.1 glutathione synthase [Aestuariivirga sp.]
MALKVAVQMDPVQSINIAGDSTFAMMLEAQRRGHRLFYYQTRTLALGGGSLFATGNAIAVRDEQGNHFALGGEDRCDLGKQDVVLMRQDPPFDMAYITATHMLETIHPGTLVVNDPKEVRNAPEKLFVLNYPQFMPETLVTRDPVEIAAFRREHGDIILKPLYGNGGAGVFRLGEGDQNFSSLLELFTQTFREPFIAQKYLPDVRRGDKRIILVDGKAAGAINRVPAVNENRSNMHVGGKAEPTTMTAREHEICEALGPDLKARGLIFAGIDVIGGCLTEINVTSPTGIREVKRFGGADIAALIWDAIEARR